MWVETALTVSQVLFAAAVALIPITYRLYFPYARRSNIAIGRLRQSDPRDTVDVNGNEVELRWVEKSESGFNKLLDAIENEGIPSGEAILGEIDGTVNKIVRIDAESTRAIWDYLDTEAPGTMLANQCAIFLEYDSGEAALISYRHFAPTEVKQLRQIRSWVDKRLSERGHYLTMIFAIGFTVVSFGLIYLRS